MRATSLLFSLSLSPLFFLSVHYEQRKKYAKYAIYIYVRFRQFLHLCISLSLSPSVWPHCYKFN